jgi:predicted glycoside hydrolase/deacetylase ChbG (UPF0249 family)
MGRLSATSVMTNCRSWKETGADLRNFSQPIGIGLHLNLTTGRALGSMPELAPDGTLPSLGTVLSRALSGRLAASELRTEIGLQLDAFESVLGRAPDFVDGHQHVHVLPGIRSALLSVLADRGLGGLVWLRYPGDRVEAILRRQVAFRKALVVSAFALGFRKAAAARGFDTNASFSGFSDFDAEAHADRTFEAAFAGLGPRPVVMCHPGHVDDELRRLDPAVESRRRELDYLASDRFAALLHAHGIELAPAP